MPPGVHALNRVTSCKLAAGIPWPAPLVHPLHGVLLGVHMLGNILSDNSCNMPR